MLPIDDARVAYVVKRYPRFSETFIVNEILAHENAGWEMDIFALRPSCDAHFQDRISQVQAPVHYLPTDKPKSGNLWDLFRQAHGELPGFWPQLADGLREDVQYVYQATYLALEVQLRGIQHLHAHFATSAAAVARLAARLAGITYTLTAHAKDIFHEDVQPGELRRRLEDAAAVITVSEFNLDYLRTQFPTAASRVQRIYNALDLNVFRYRSPAARPARIIGVGRLVEKKGFSVLIEACRILAERGQSFECQIVGDGELENSLRRQIERLSLLACVKLVRGCPQAEIIDRMQNSAVLAAPCLVGDDGNRDGLPTVLLEAMALGTPCVSTDVTGIPEVIDNENTGLRIAEKDATQLADALQRLLEDSALRVRLAEAARSRIECDFDIDQNAALQRQVFLEAITPSSRQRPVEAVEAFD